MGGFTATKKSSCREASHPLVRSRWPLNVTVRGAKFRLAIRGSRGFIRAGRLECQLSFNAHGSVGVVMLTGTSTRQEE
jgi:hypothetical protein